MKKILSLILVLSMVLALGVMFTSCGDENEGTGEQVAVLDEVALGAKFTVPDDFKIGFICLHDKNSTYDLNFLNAVDTIKAHLGLTDAQVIVETNIPEDNACYEAAKRLVNQGCKVVFANSFGHEDHIIKAAEENPNVQFCHATGTKALVKTNLSNYHNAFASIYEGRFLAGVAAGLKLNEMIENGDIKAEEAVIGYVGAYPYAEVKSGYTSFFLGARSVCESATMKVRFTDSWYDYDKEKEAANSLISIDKCVLISQHADSMGAPTACENAGIPNVAYNGATGKNTFVIASRIDWVPYFEYMLDCVKEGKDIATDWTGTLENGAVKITAVGAAAAAGTQAKLDEVAAELKAGTVKVFDCANFTVNGQNLTEYLADVDDMGDFVPETNVIKTENGVTFFDESAFRSAPYFDIRIDGITEVNN